MPRINKDKGKQGNAKTIRVSAAERRGAQKGGRVSAGDVHAQLDPNDKSDQAFHMVRIFYLIFAAPIIKLTLHSPTRRDEERAATKATEGEASAWEERAVP